MSHDRKRVVIESKGPVSPEEIQDAFQMMTGMGGMSGTMPGLMDENKKAELLGKLQALRKLQGAQ